MRSQLLTYLTHSATERTSALPKDIGAMWRAVPGEFIELFS
jgi:hypothetical protein